MIDSNKVAIKEAGIETITINEFLILCKKTTLLRPLILRRLINRGTESAASSAVLSLQFEV
jgi:hypothetical protein